MLFEGTYFWIDDQKQTLLVEAKTHPEAKSLFEARNTGERWCYEVKAYEYSYNFTISGIVNGKEVKTPLIVHAVTDDVAIKHAKKFFGKIYGQFKRKDRSVVEVTSFEFEKQNVPKHLFL